MIRSCVQRENVNGVSLFPIPSANDKQQVDEAPEIPTVLTPPTHLSVVSC